MVDKLKITLVGPLNVPVLLFDPLANFVVGQIAIFLCALALVHN